LEAKLQRRIQRYGWDLAAGDYEPLWQEQLAQAQRAMLQAAAPAPGERVLDVACGTGLATFDAARAVAPGGDVLGVDISARMVEAARERASQLQLSNACFSRMDAESLALSPGSFDVALCALGFMYFPDPRQALHEMCKALRPGGRVAIAVWGQRARCGWSAIFPIVDAEVSSDVCPLFFSLGNGESLAELCASAGLKSIEQQRIATTLDYTDAEQACAAAFVGGPVALAWSRFDSEVRARVCERYVEAIAPWRCEDGSYRLPGEFVIVSAVAPPTAVG